MECLTFLRLDMHKHDRNLSMCKMTLILMNNVIYLAESVRYVIPNLFLYAKSYGISLVTDSRG